MTCSNYIPERIQGGGILAGSMKLGCSVDHYVAADRGTADTFSLKLTHAAQEDLAIATRGHGECSHSCGFVVFEA